MLLSKVLVLLTAGIIAGASPTSKHNHQRLHAVKRAQPWTTVDVPGPTIIQYIVDGKIVSHDEVCKGIEAGNLVWKNPNDGLSRCSSSSTATIGNPTSTSTVFEVSPSLPSVVIAHKQAVNTTPSPSPTSEQKQDINTTPTPSPPSVSTEEKQAVNTTPAPSPPSVAVDQTQDVNTTPVQSTQAPELPAESVSSTPEQSPTATSSDPAPVFTSPAAETSLVGTSSSQSGNISEGQGLELEFPDGTIDCSTFPSQYGPIEIEWARLGGWAGIQYITVEGNSVTTIVTAVPGGEGCIPGAMCSYACPPGYQKSQWPSTQGLTGQSVGGIQCNSAGKLTLTNPNLSKTLCIKGTGATIVQNKLSSNAAICRTDYPGSSIV